jgi:lysyl-tRNA synthetase class 1
LIPLEQAPLAARIGQTVMAKNHIAAKVGSVEDDPFGRLVRQASQAASLSDVWLVNVLNRAIEMHGVTPGHFASWAARTGLFDDLTLLNEGVSAWFVQDYIKAVHVLVPQVEHGLRGIVSKLGLPVTKPHSTIGGVSVAINMGDILYSKEITEPLGPDLTLYFLTLYADPRGFNLRNNIAHGLMEAERIGYGVATRVIHTLLVLGLWKEIAKARR